MRNLARWSFRHRRIVLASWVVAVILITGIASGVGSDFSNSFTLPGTDSSRALALLKHSARKLSGDSDQIVIATQRGTVTDPRNRARINAMLTKVEHLPHVGGVVSPYGPHGASQISKRGTIAYATVTFDEQAQQLPLKAIDRVVSVAKSADGAGVQVQLGGQAAERSEGMGVGGLGIGIVLALIVLLVVFGSVLAALLPLITAGVALGSGVGVMEILSHAISMPSFATQLALLIGLGVGVDYALFIVTRYRQAVLRGHSAEASVIEAIDTSGRAVLFAGITVCVALLGMLALRLSFLSGVGIAAACVVACTVLSALTLLPAMLGFFGPRVLSRRNRRDLAAGVVRVDDESRIWARWARTLQKRPALFAALAATAMLLIAIPVLSLRLGSIDAASDPTSSTTYKAYELLADGFGPGFNGPLQLTARVDSQAQRTQFAHVLTAVAHTKDVASVSPARVIGQDVETADAFERGSPQAKSTSDLVTDLRDHVIPGAEQGRVHILIGGQTAIFADFATVIKSKLALFITVVVLLSFLLLMAVFRSIVIPAVAAVMNLLSVAAAFGVVTAVFQKGFLASAIGVNQTGPIEAFLPVIVFAILFGLSMDYEVFLVSRIYEEWRRRGDNTEAVVHGLSATGRTITAAAAIMVLVFAAFVLGGQIVIKLFGVGLASAVFLDALLVRSVLIPSIMLMIGKHNWSLPSGLDRLLPQLNIEGDGGGAAAEPLPVAPREPEPATSRS